VLGEALELLLELLDARALLADHDARTRGVDVHLHLVRGALDLDAGDARREVLLLHAVPQLDVLVKPVRVVLLCEPLRVPSADDAEAKAVRMCLLTHGIKPSDLAST